MLEWERRVSVRTGLYARLKTIVIGDRAFSTVILMTMPAWIRGPGLVLSFVRAVIIIPLVFVPLFVSMFPR